MEPTAEPLALPEDYGKAATTLHWAAVRANLERAERYWIATTRRDGRPHVVPVDGIWLADLWYYGGSGEAVHQRAVAANPRVVMHLEDAMKAVIVEGEVRRTKPPSRVLAWTQFPSDATRFRFD